MCPWNDEYYRVNTVATYRIVLVSTDRTDISKFNVDGFVDS